MEMFMRAYTIISVMFFSAIFQLHAATWYVDCTQASDQGDGLTWTTAKKSIQSAIDCAASNDLVLVSKGVYSPIRVQNKILTIQSTDGFEETFIDAQYSRPCVIFNSTNSVIHGFTIQNGTGGEAMEGLSWDGIQYPSGSAGGVVGATVVNCRIRNNTQYAVYCSYNSYLYSYPYNSASYYSAGGAVFCVLLNCILVENSTELNGGAAVWFLSRRLLPKRRLAAGIVSFFIFFESSFSFFVNIIYIFDSNLFLLILI
jgi:hypothetical protein